eukprot:3344863-Amphidinium_carterae.1
MAGEVFDFKLFRVRALQVFKEHAVMWKSAVCVCVCVDERSSPCSRHQQRQPDVRAAVACRRGPHGGGGGRRCGGDVSVAMKWWRILRVFSGFRILWFLLPDGVQVTRWRGVASERDESTRNEGAEHAAVQRHAAGPHVEVVTRDSDATVT